MISQNNVYCQSTYPIINYTENGKYWIYTDSLNNGILRLIKKTSMIDTLYSELEKRDNIIILCDSLKGTYKILYDRQYSITSDITNKFSALKTKYDRKVLQVAELQDTVNKVSSKKKLYKNLFLTATGILGILIGIQTL